MEQLPDDVSSLRSELASLGKERDLLAHKLADLERIERSVRDNEETYRTIIEQQSELICRFSPEGILTFVNDAYCRYFGKTKEDLNGRSFFFLIPPAEHDPLRRYLASLTEDNPIGSTEHRVVLPSGEVRWQQWTDKALFQNGVVTGYQSVGRDITERKRAEELLRKSEERYRRITRVMTDYIYSVRIEHGYPVETVHTDTCYTVSGYTPDDFIRDPYLWIDMVYRDDRSAVREHVARILLGRDVAPIEHRIVRKDGTIRWVRNTPARHYNENGELVSYDGLIQDITDQKEAEQTVRDREIRYRGLFDNMSSGVAVYEAVDNGADFVFKDINRSAERIESLMREQVIGKRIGSVFPAIVEFGLFAVLQRVMHTGLAEHVPAAFYRDERISGWRESYVYRLPTGEIVVVYDDVTARKKAEEALQAAYDQLERRVAERTAELALANKDLSAEITEHKQTAKALRESEQRYRTLFESAAEGILIIDLESLQVQYANPAACELFGYDEQVLQMKMLPDLHPPDVIEGVVQEFRTMSAREKKLIREVACLHSDGHLMYVDINTTTTLMGRRRCAIGFLRDITQQKQMEERLLRSEKLAAIGQLAGAIGHEFRNQLGIMRNVAYFLKLKLADADGKIRKHLHILEEEIVHTDRIIENILTFAKTRHPQLKRVDPKDLVRECIEKVKVPRSVTVTSSIDPQLPEILADRIQIIRVFVNVIMNAIQAIEETGSDGQIVIRVVRTREAVVFTFADTGAGMKEEDKRRLFDPLFSTKARGTGLGLATAKLLVEEHNGTITLSSECGRGTQVVIVLPIDQ